MRDLCFRFLLFIFWYVWSLRMLHWIIEGIYFENPDRNSGSSFWLARLRPSMVCFRPDENIKVCSVLVSCQAAEVSQSVSEHQRSREDGVTGPECHCPRNLQTTVSPSVKDWSPACGAAFSLIDLHGTSQELRTSVHCTYWLGGAAGCVPIYSGQQVKAGLSQASGRLWSSWPGEQNTIRYEILFPIVAAPGAAERGLEVAELSVHVFIRYLKREVLRHYRRFFEVTGVHMMYTITRGPSKLVTQRRTGEWVWLVSKTWCNVSIRQLLGHANASCVSWICRVS